MAPVASILRLPIEVTEHVLYKVLEPDLFDWARVADRRFELCFVCTRWRDVIYGAAEFWCHIPVTCSHSPTGLAFVLERARTRTLSVFILARDFELSKRPSAFILPVRLVAVADCMTTILSMLDPAYKYYLTLDCGTLESWRVIWAIICTKALPLLKRLSITMQQPAVSAARSFLYESFPDTTIPFELHELRLSCAPVLWTGPAFYARLSALRLSNLTRNRAVGWTTFVDAITQATDLRLLQLSMVDWIDVPDDIPSISLQSLTDLHITFADGASILPLLDTNQRSILFPVDTRPFASGFALVVKRHSRSPEVTVWRHGDTEGNAELIKYTGRRHGRQDEERKAVDLFGNDVITGSFGTSALT
ncbi:hypothetical protein C8R45DRAFT_939922 [Mycena sanguinolenta]|nr:hypothetical protein C8R45DRAFT_939922 [Mycena sanguinolenta]